MKKIIFKLGSSIFASLVFAYIISNIFMDSLYRHKYDEFLKMYTYEAGTVYRKREEGWANTYIGKHNTFGLQNDHIEGTIKKIAIWGDSEVESFQVNDDKDIETILGKYLHMEYSVFAVAHSGFAIADYVVNIPKYEQLIKNIEKHYIILCSFKDALPDESTRYTKFVSDNTIFNLIESDAVPDKHKVVSYLAKFNLRFVLYVSGLISRYEPKLPFVKSAKLNTSENNNITKYNKSDAWDFILGRLRESTDKEVSIIYCPYIPRIENHTLMFDDPDYNDKEAFKQKCNDHGVGFIDMTAKFVSLLNQKHVFPRGFHNTMPGKGHMNEHAHKIIAESIYDHMHDNVEAEPN